MAFPDRNNETSQPFTEGAIVIIDGKFGTWVVQHRSTDGKYYLQPNDEAAKRVAPKDNAGLFVSCALVKRAA